jgi:hypothetical protein
LPAKGGVFLALFDDLVRQGMGMFRKLAVGGIQLFRAQGEQTLGLKPGAAFLRQPIIDTAKPHTFSVNQTPARGRSMQQAC